MVNSLREFILEPYHSLKLGQKLIIAAAPAKVMQIASELNKQFFNLQLPEISVVSHLKSNWLGLAQMQIKNGQPYRSILLQASIVDHEDTLRRVIAHELIHIYQYTQGEFFKKWAAGNFKMSKVEYEMTRPDAHHDSIFTAFTAKINAVYGNDYITPTSNSTYILQNKKKFYLVIAKGTDGRLRFVSFSRLSPNGKKYLSQLIEAMAKEEPTDFFIKRLKSSFTEFKIIETTNAEFLTKDSLNGKWYTSPDKSRVQELEEMFKQPGIAPERFI